MSSPSVQKVRADFPILSSKMNGKPLIYFDNGASTQKPQAVIDAITKFYANDYANVHRGFYELSQRATDHFEGARQVVANFLGGVAPEECIFTRGTTESINLVASSWGRSNLKPGDEVVLSGLEHHSNIVPWQFACSATGAVLRIVQPDSDGRLSLADFRQQISNKTRMVAIQHTSNALGVVHDVAEIAKLAKTVGAAVLIDGAQSVAHQPTQLLELACDFFAFSAHKLYGPTGIGVLWGRRDLLANLPPFLGGGDMIETVSFEHTTFAALPNRFEAGTPHISGAVGLAAAIEYVQDLGFDWIIRQEELLLEHATAQLRDIPGVRILGDVRPKAAILSFVVESPMISPMDLATWLAMEGIAIRTGHHCCMPLMKQLKVGGTCRASLAFYNTLEEIDRFADVLSALIDQQRVKSSNSTTTRLAAEESPATSIGLQLDNLSFARSAGQSPAKVADELADEFLAFDDKESKTQLLLELGQELPASFATLKNLTTSVPGCMSEVYLIGRACPTAAERIEFAGDSNAQIVRGLIALLQQLFSGQNAQQVLEFDLESFFRKIGLDQFISSQRRSGLSGMISRIRGLASSISESVPS